MKGRRKGQRVGPYWQRSANWLHQARIDLDLTQAELAALAGVSRRTIVAIETTDPYAGWTGHGTIRPGQRREEKLRRAIESIKVQRRSTLRISRSPNAQRGSTA